jgi:hypothetical protein
MRHVGAHVGAALCRRWDPCAAGSQSLAGTGEPAGNGFRRPAAGIRRNGNDRAKIVQAARRRLLHSCDDVEAEQKPPHWKVPLATSETVRAGVANEVPNDMHSWVGENHYVAAVRGIQLADDRNPRQLVLPALTTGGPSSLAGIVFSGQDEESFSYVATKLSEGEFSRHSSLTSHPNQVIFNSSSNPNR